jgi:hypothetical protein
MIARSFAQPFRSRRLHVITGVAMAIAETDAIEIERDAYELAWDEISALPDLTPHEKISAPHYLRRYIHIMIEVGERNPSKIAKASVAMLREYEQVLRSKARVLDPPTSNLSR